MHALSQGQLRDVLQALSSSGCVWSMTSIGIRARKVCLTIKELGSNRQYPIWYGEWSHAAKPSFLQSRYCFFSSEASGSGLWTWAFSTKQTLWAGGRVCFFYGGGLGNALSSSCFQGAAVGACRGSRALRHSLWAFDQWVAWFWNGSLPFPLKSLIWWQFGVRHQPNFGPYHTVSIN